jgi:hypothetical protein
MGLTAYPRGISSMGVPVIPGSNTAPIMGSVYFVDSATGSNSNSGADKDHPFATLDYAIGKCTANKGDVIYVMPNHAETITGAGGITADIAGVDIIGVGKYDNRPRFLMDAGTTVTFLVSAADVSISNLVFAGGHSDIAKCFNVTGVGCTIDRCEFRQNTADENFLTCIEASGAANTADGLTVTNCFAYGVDASTVAFVSMIDDSIGLTLIGNVAISEGTGLATLVTVATGKDIRACRILGNFLSSKATAGNLFISNDTASPNNSGIVAHNRCRHADVTAGHVLGAVGGCGFFDNLSASTDAVSGFVLPAIDADS